MWLVSPISCGGGGCVGLAAGQLQHHLVGQALTNYEVQKIGSKVGNSSVKLKLIFDSNSESHLP